MQEQTRKTVKLVIDSNKQAIKNSETKVALKKNPNLLIDNQKKDKIEIEQRLSNLRDQYTELLPFVKGIKKYIKDITETTHVCAVYLLLCHTFQNWNSLFLLAEHGKNSATQTLIRMIKESLMLTELFVVEFSENARENLDKWYSGEIISHGVGREVTSKFFDEYSSRPDLNTKKREAYIYQMESLVVHNSYASILGCISPFTEDVDFEGYTGFYRTKFALKASPMTTTNITLKAVYSLLLKDQCGLQKLNEILLKYNPGINSYDVSKIMTSLKKVG